MATDAKATDPSTIPTMAAVCILEDELVGAF